LHLQLIIVLQFWIILFHLAEKIVLTENLNPKKDFRLVFFLGETHITETINRKKPFCEIKNKPSAETNILTETRNPQKVSAKAKSFWSLGYQITPLFTSLGIGVLFCTTVNIFVCGIYIYIIFNIVNVLKLGLVFLEIITVIFHYSMY
jgi:hypothetical protein